MQQQRGTLLVISAPSGTGKGTIVTELLRARPEVRLSRSCTTRAPRGKEVDGVEYFFKTRQEFEAMIAENALLEYADVYGQYYGTPRAFVEEQLARGRDVILEIDTVGGQQVTRNMPEAVAVFLLPPSMEELHRRIVGRKTETEEKIRVRFRYAYEELKNAGAYAYAVVNDVPERAAARILSILEAEKCRMARHQPFINQLAQEEVQI